MHTKNQVLSSKVIAQTNRETDRQADTIENITYPHMQVIIREQVLGEDITLPRHPLPLSL